MSRRQVMIGHDPGIVLEQHPAVGRFQVALDGHEAFLADFHEDFIQELEQCNIVVAFVPRALHEADRAGKGGFADLGGIARHERA
jgi:hypothetical protein